MKAGPRPFLALTGGGDTDYFRTLDQEVMRICSETKDGRLLIVPFACDPEDFDDIEERVLSQIGDAFSSTTMLRREEDFAGLDLRDFRLIFLEGGNTFQLMQSLTQMNALTKIHDYAQAGGSLYGDSAGAIVLGANIATAFFGDEADDNISSLQTYLGSGLLESWSIHCHYKPEDDGAARDFVFDQGSPILALPETVGMIIEGGDTGQARVYGKGSAVAFHYQGQNVYASGEVFSLKDLL